MATATQRAEQQGTRGAGAEGGRCTTRGIGALDGVCDASTPLGAVSFSDGRNDLPTAIRAPPPPRVAHSMPLGLPYLGDPAFFRRAAGLGTAAPVLAGRRPPCRLESGVSCCISAPRYSPGKGSGEHLPRKV